jgi:hypothetical protein
MWRPQRALLELHGEGDTSGAGEEDLMRERKTRMKSSRRSSCGAWWPMSAAEASTAVAAAATEPIPFL